MSRRRFHTLPLFASVTLLTACVYLPTTVQGYDRDCQVVAKQMVLQAVQVASINGCANEGCVALIVAASAVTAASAIVSGTIVVAGNIVYWVERKTRCSSGP